MKRILWLAGLLGCGGAPAVVAQVGDPPDPLTAVTIPALPNWTARYTPEGSDDPRAFQIEALMATHGLSRLQAVELQNHFRDLNRAEPSGDPTAQFGEALARVQRGDLESGLDPKALQAAPFIVVFDLDDTLYDQYRTSADCADVTYVQADGKPRHIKFTPGWDTTIKAIRAAGGLVVLFSANLDEPTLENLRHATLDGAPLLGHPDIAGVLTNSHLVQQTKHEGPGRENPTKGRPVLEPSKDLRVLDESLERVIIVDDNPLRLFQFRNARVFKKFHADAFCAASDPVAAAAYGDAMVAVAAEVTESAAYATAHGVPFSTAYLPYTTLGRIAVEWLSRAPDLDGLAARDHLRRHPELADDRF